MTHDQPPTPITRSAASQSGPQSGQQPAPTGGEGASPALTHGSLSAHGLRAADAAWRSPRAWFWLAIVTAVALIVDLWSKWLAFKHIAPFPAVINKTEVLSTDYLSKLIPPHDSLVVVPGLLEFTLVLNPGAVFGMGAGKRAFFIFFTGFALLFALYMFAAMTTVSQRFSQAAIGLLLAGGLGNLYDRIVFACVRDFLHPLPGLTWPVWAPARWAGQEVWPYVSNIADLWLILGIGVLIIRSLRPPPVPVPAPSVNP